MPRRTLIACLGNIFLGDDGFGVEVVKELRQRELPECVCVIDFGIRGFDLAYALMDGYEAAILVDAAPQGGKPGTVYTIEPDLAAVGGTPETHGMNPVRALSLVNAMGGMSGRILLVGCEPDSVPADEWEHGLSPAVQSAVPEAVRVIEDLITRILSRQAIQKGRVPS